MNKIEITQLTEKKLDVNPFWKFINNEKDFDETFIEPTNEATVRKDGRFIVKCKYILPDNSEFMGYVVPMKSETIDYTQPIIIKDNKHINFWYGILKPTQKEISDNYNYLGKKNQKIFPIKYQYSLKGIEYSGEIKGFGYLKDILLWEKIVYLK